MSDLRRLIAKMDQLNEQGKPIGRDARLPPLEGPGGGGGSGTVTSGPSPFGSVFNRPTAAPTTTAPTTIPLGGLQSKTPGTIRVGTPEVPPVSAPSVPPAVIRKRGDPKFDPTLSKTDAQRQQELKDVEARMNALQAQQGKPKVDIKDVQRQKELQQQISGDPRPAVWKDPRSPDAPASKSPPPADVEPPAPLSTKPTTEKSSTLAPKDPMGRTEPKMEPEPTDPVLSARPGELAGRREPEMGRDPYSPATYKDMQDFMTKQSSAAADTAEKEGPGFLSRNWGKLATGATAAGAGIGEYEREKYSRWKGAQDADRLAHPDDDFWSIQNQIKDFGIKPNVTPKTPTKESLQNKLFKEFKTFIEKK